MAIRDDRAPRKPDLESERPGVLAAQCPSGPVSYRPSVLAAQCLSGPVS